MFKLSFDDRLSAWTEVRRQVDSSQTPFQEIIDFWSKAPLLPVNPEIDPFYQSSWPTPWEIIENNRYDDFTKTVMMGYTVLLTEKFKNSKVEIRTLVDKDRKRLYNVVYIDDKWVLNFLDFEMIESDKISNSFRVENLILLQRPR
jgi:hypothetical protein